MGVPTLTDPTLLLQAGIDPKTGLPLKFTDATEIKQNIKKLLRVVDEQDAVRRYVWYNLPDGLDEILERVLYYKGQGMFFYSNETEKFYFLPYALDGEIDCYGRFLGVVPVPFGGTAESEKRHKIWLSQNKKLPVYEIPTDEEMQELDIDKCCVLLCDYSKQLSQTVLSRQMLNDPLLDVMANCIPFMNTGLQNSTGVHGMRVNNQDEYSNVLAANRSLKKAALEGDANIPIIGNVEFQEMTGTNVSVPSDFMQAMESLDNFRLGLYGIDNGGLFQKQAHMLQTEQDMAGGANSLIYQDGLSLRQKFCDIVNSIWDIGIWCEASECVEGDQDMDGEALDEQDQSGTGEGTQPVEQEVINE